MNVGRRHHAYKTVWVPLIGETLAVNCEECNLHNSFAAKYLNLTIVGHLTTFLITDFTHHRLGLAVITSLSNFSRPEIN